VHWCRSAVSGIWFSSNESMGPRDLTLCPRCNVPVLTANLAGGAHGVRSVQPHRPTGCATDPAVGPPGSTDRAAGPAVGTADSAVTATEPANRAAGAATATGPAAP